MRTLNRRQQGLLVAVTLLILLAWPAGNGSLGIKFLRWAVDPMHSLPTLPDDLPPGLDDNGDAVTAHDAALTEYYDRYSESSTTRRRMEWKEATDPFDRTTTRQLLVALGIAGIVGGWVLRD
jgi:hypothetical protein